LEVKAANELSRCFDVQNQPAFIDLDEGKSREGDMLAKETFPKITKENVSSDSRMVSDKRILAQLILVIECKNLPDHGWIFTQAKIEQYFQYFTLIRTKDYLLKSLNPRRTLDEIVGTNNSFERFLKSKPQNGTVKPRNKTNEQTNNIYDLSLKVIKLSRYLINEDKNEAKALLQVY
jgi:hypothetical protein